LGLQASARSKEPKIKPEASKLLAEKLGKALPKTGDKPTPEEKPLEPNKEFLWQLKDMGFPEELGKRALIKVKNESVAAAVEAAVTLQAEAPA
jgi:uncharacterized UBP type Zn finger protein